MLFIRNNLLVLFHFILYSVSTINSVIPIFLFAYLNLLQFISFIAFFYCYINAIILFPFLASHSPTTSIFWFNVIFLSYRFQTLSKWYYHNHHIYQFNSYQNQEDSQDSLLISSEICTFSFWADQKNLLSNLTLLLIILTKL